jgi:hypothetical protein
MANASLRLIAMPSGDCAGVNKISALSAAIFA